MTGPVSSTPVTEAKRAVVVGVGLIGGSIALGLRKAGWHVTGIDHDQPLSICQCLGTPRRPGVAGFVLQPQARWQLEFKT